MIQNLINHVVLVVDKSASMQGRPVVGVFDAALARLKQRSIDLNQETRISIYLFNQTVEVLTFDMDVMRFQTLKDHYKADGMTALIDATIKALEDHRKLPELYGDHAFLAYVITDGQENRSSHFISELQRTIVVLPKANWTLACLVPDAMGKSDAKKFGFPDESIAIWDTTAVGGFEKVGKQFTSAVDNYMTARAAGVRATSSLFTLDSSNLVKQGLKRVHPADYDMFNVYSESPIKEYVESFTKQPYRLGSTYYMPTKAVKIQEYKKILVQDVRTGTVYEGGGTGELRQALGLPTQTVDVDPGQHRDWRIFVQSTSVNRKLFPGTFIVVMK
jgi:hypothetical protein